MKHLIIGNGAAGMSAAGKLRELNENDEITVICAESESAYAKIMLPDYIGGKMERRKLFVRDQQYYESIRARLMPDSKAEMVDTANRRVVLTDNRIEGYDRLLIAAGGSPFIPRVEGLDGVRYYTVNSIRDADEIRRSAVAGRNAVIIGGGLTGIEMAFALARLGMKVFIAEQGPVVLPQQLDTDSASIMSGYLEKAGVTLITGASIRNVDGSGPSQGVDMLPPEGRAELADGREIPFHMLVVAVGTRPNIGLVQGTPVQCGRGIRVDRFMQTSEESVYAAGDIAEASYGPGRGYVSCYIWPNAMAQGRCAAMNMAGHEQEYNFNVSVQNPTQLRDMPFYSMGLVKPEGSGYEIMAERDEQNGIYKKIILEGPVIKGIMLIGDVRTANTLAGLLRKGTDVSAFGQRLLDMDFRI